MTSPEGNNRSIPIEGVDRPWSDPAVGDLLVRSMGAHMSFIRIIQTLWSADQFSVDKNLFGYARELSVNTILCRIRDHLPPDVGLYSLGVTDRVILLPKITTKTILLPELEDSIAYTYSADLHPLVRWMYEYKAYDFRLIPRANPKVLLLMDLLMFRFGKKVSYQDIMTHFGSETYSMINKWDLVDKSLMPGLSNVLYNARHLINDYPQKGFSIQSTHGIGLELMYAAR